MHKSAWTHRHLRVGAENNGSARSACPQEMVYLGGRGRLDAVGRREVRLRSRGRERARQEGERQRLACAPTTRHAAPRDGVLMEGELSFEPDVRESGRPSALSRAE